MYQIPRRLESIHYRDPFLSKGWLQDKVLHKNGIPLLAIPPKNSHIITEKEKTKALQITEFKISSAARLVVPST